jgi:glycosyltransferase involved in cell wall biosynthesis
LRRAVARTVLILHSSAGLYGADRALLTMAAGLDPDRWRAVVVLPERGELTGALEDAGVEVIVHPLAVLRRSEAGPAGLAALAGRARADRAELGELARKRAAAVVHSNTSVIVAGQAIARAAGAAHLVHVREIYAPPGTGTAERVLWPVWRRLLLRADALACVSRAVADALGSSRAFVLYDGPVRAVEPAERGAARATLGVPAEAFAVALVGRVNGWKGQDVLARALAEPALAQRGAVGIVAGDPFPGEERHAAALDRLAASLGLGDRLVMTGFRPDIGTVLGAADALAVPSTRPEPFGLVALEAAAAGLPVVASAHGGVTEIVRDGETGLLVAPGDPSALAGALAELAADPERTRALGTAARADVARRFDPGAMLSELQASYDALAGDGDRAHHGHGADAGHQGRR